MTWDWATDGAAFDRWLTTQPEPGPCACRHAADDHAEEGHCLVCECSRYDESGPWPEEEF